MFVKIFCRIYPNCKSFSWANNAFIEIQNYSRFLEKKFVSKLILGIGHKELFYSIGSITMLPLVFFGV